MALIQSHLSITPESDRFLTVLMLCLRRQQERIIDFLSDPRTPGLPHLLVLCLMKHWVGSSAAKEIP